MAEGLHVHLPEHAADKVLHAATAVGDVMRDALLSIVTTPPHDHWEEVLADYDRRHPATGSGAA